MPTATALAKAMAEHFSIDAGHSFNLSKIAQVVELRRGRTELLAFLSERLSGFEPDNGLRWLICRTWRAIFTTNYDDVIERAFDLSSDQLQRPVTISLDSSYSVVDPRFQVPIYHLHGSLFSGSPPNILITENDYATFRERRRMLFEVLKQEMTSSVILYAGYSHDDPNWNTVFQELLAEFAPTPLPQSYRIAPQTPPIDSEILERNLVTTVDCTTSDLVKAVQAELGDIHVDPKSVDDLRETIPHDLRPGFDLNVAQMTRLLSSWEYVNQTDFASNANVYQFLRGEKPNWPCIAGDNPFTRDVEEAVSETLLDYVTAPRGGRKTLLVLGSAGYGTTTLLMMLATSLVKQRVGPIFMHRAGTPIREGDIEFATTLLSRRPIFIVDDAASNARHISRAIQQLGASRREACFLLGDRTNQWRQLPYSITAKEFAIEPLSETEITRLLDCLAKHNELGELAKLPPDMQAAAVRSKHDRQLLVALRELTEGRAFDAIIEDEFRRIENEVARRLYAIVACTYQLRILAREAVIAMVLGQPDIPSMHHAVGHALDGVVDSDCVDEANGIYALRCRHHAVAEIVWSRCVMVAERQEILLDLVDSLNFTHFLDRQLFDELIQSDEEIDRLGALEVKTKFFETACKKDPDNPYVRQHYARMLLRERHYELALQEINAALQMSKARILFHTRGLIFRDMALSGSTDSVARRRLVSSENDFRESITRSPRDAYGYHSLAELFFGWAQKCNDDEEEADYISKAEAVIADGLSKVRNRDGLWIVSAKMQEWLGNRPRAVANLGRAGSSPVARYLLAKIRIDQGKADEAIDILKALVMANPKNVRFALLYAGALLLAGKPYVEAIAILWLANISGLRDARYVVTLIGLFFLNKQFSEAKRIIDSASSGTFLAEEKSRVTFRPVPPVELHGVISSVKGHYAFVSVPGYPEIYCSYTKIGNTILTKGHKVRFRLAFSLRGAFADGISPVD